MQQERCNPRVSTDVSSCQERLSGEIACLKSAMTKGAGHSACPAQQWTHHICQKLIGRRETLLRALSSGNALLPARTPHRSR